MFIEILAAALIGGLAGGVVGAGVGFIIGCFIDEDSLRSEVGQMYDDAFILLIEEKKKNAVSIGIFDEDEEYIADGVEIESEQGVSDSLYVGQIIYLQ